MAISSQFEIIVLLSARSLNFWEFFFFFYFLHINNSRIVDLQLSIYCIIRKIESKKVETK